jgi:polyferredoxin
LQTGEIAEHLLWGKSNLVETHATFANLTHFSYMIIAIIYAFTLIITNKIGEKHRPIIIKNNIQKIIHLLTHTTTHYIIILMSIIWFIALSITGALGSAITHGTTNDPISAWTVNTFVSQ